MQDGFHYTKQALSKFEDIDNAFKRRGAPFTFDAAAFVRLVATLKTTPVATTMEPETSIFAPSFDHAIKDPVEDAISISSRTRIVIVEGNYTLLNQTPWRDVAESCAER
jgi:pantothenate kinase